MAEDLGSLIILHDRFQEFSDGFVQLGPRVALASKTDQGLVLPALTHQSPGLESRNRTVKHPVLEQLHHGFFPVALHFFGVSQGQDQNSGAIEGLGLDITVHQCASLHKSLGGGCQDLPRAKASTPHEAAYHPESSSLFHWELGFAQLLLKQFTIKARQ